MNDQLVSIPVFVYNGEKFLRKQLDSLLNQTYKNIEIIICDDCSKDNSLAIIKEYENLSNVKYYTNEKNLGITKNVEKGFSLCTGDYIATCDHDDIWAENKVEVLLDNIGDNTLIYSNSVMMDEEDNLLPTNPSIQKLSGRCHKSLILQNFVSGHTLMFKKEIMQHILPFPKNYIHPDWWIAYVAACAGEIRHIDQTLVYYRQHATQITKAKKTKFIEPISKYIYKIKQYNNGLKSRQEVLQALASSHLNDLPTKSILDQLIKQTQALRHSYINAELYTTLISSENELLLPILQKNRQKTAKKLSRGLWYIRAKELPKILLFYAPLLIILIASIYYFAKAPQ